MNKFFVLISVLSVITLLSFTGCSAKKPVDNSYYDRANSASSKAMKRLDKE